MHAPESFPFLLDEIFAELDLASKIEIVCTIAVPGKEEPDQDIRILFWEEDRGME